MFYQNRGTFAITVKREVRSKSEGIFVPNSKAEIMEIATGVLKGFAKSTLTLEVINFLSCRFMLMFLLV